jgi:hypothetical protein
MNRVYVFKTDVQSQTAARQIILFLKRNIADSRISFDLDDCDKILRIESRRGPVDEWQVRLLLSDWGYACEPLMD